MQNIAKKHRGFSFIELLTVISIIGIMSAVAFVSLSSSKSSAKLSAAQREVAGAIKLAQSYTLQGRMETNENGSGLAVPCGYGFHFISPTDYEIFYNPGPTRCTEKNSGEDIGYDKFYRQYRDSGGPDPSKIAEAGSLKDGVSLKPPFNTGDTEIYFTTPSARMFDWNGNLVTNLIPLEFQDPAENTKTITINPSGSITEE